MLVKGYKPIKVFHAFGFYGDQIQSSIELEMEEWLILLQIFDNLFINSIVLNPHLIITDQHHGILSNLPNFCCSGNLQIRVVTVEDH